MALSSTHRKSKPKASEAEINNFIEKGASFNTLKAAHSDSSISNSDQTKAATGEKKKMGRPHSTVKKVKVSFDLTEELLKKLNECAQRYGITRAGFISIAIAEAIENRAK